MPPLALIVSKPYILTTRYFLCISASKPSPKALILKIYCASYPPNLLAISNTDP